MRSYQDDNELLTEMDMENNGQDTREYGYCKIHLLRGTQDYKKKIQDSQSQG
jgi:hypothetical protein